MVSIIVAGMAAPQFTSARAGEAIRRNASATTMRLEVRAGSIGAPFGD